MLKIFLKIKEKTYIVTKKENETSNKSYLIMMSKLEW